LLFALGLCRFVGVDGNRKCLPGWAADALAILESNALTENRNLSHVVAPSKQVLTCPSGSAILSFSQRIFFLTGQISEKGRPIGRPFFSVVFISDALVFSPQ
jgi:hypothetical protein